mgnify:CR=1 FL=1
MLGKLKGGSGYAYYVYDEIVQFSFEYEVNDQYRYLISHDYSLNRGKIP